MSHPCTCGVKFTGGLHSGWCDSLRPDEPLPDTEPRYDGLMSWLPPGAAVFYNPFGSTSLHPAQPQAPAKPKPQPTPFGDGTNALDEVCTCGCYITRPGLIYSAPDYSMHGTRACLDKAGNWHRSPTPKP